MFQKEFIFTILKIAYPVVLGMMARTFMNIVDTAMVGRLGQEAVAAAGLASLVIWIIVSSFIALSTAVQATVSRRFGEGRLHACGRVVNTILIISIGVGIVLAWLGYSYGARIFPFLVSDPVVINHGSGYLKIRFLECFSFLIIMLFRGFFNGIGHTRVYMVVMFVSNAMNVILNYLLIFGHFGFPRLEVMGAGVASTISSYLGLAIIFGYALLSKYRKPYHILRLSDFHPKLLVDIGRLCWPVALRLILVHASFTVFLKIMGMVGTAELAASNIVIAITSLSWMPGHGVGVASATMVGQSMGRGKPDDAEKYGWESVKLGIIFMGFFGALFFVIPAPFLWIFTQDPRVIELGTIALRILAAIQFIDAVGIILSESLEGAGMVRYVMRTEIMISWLYFVPASFLFSVTLGWGIAGGWFSLAGYALLFAFSMSYKFREGSWKSVKV